MRPGQQNKRGRGRSNNNNNKNNNSNNHRKGGNPLTRTYDSSGPDVKIRGTAQHIAEKYTALHRDAQSSGDRVIAENYLQHAEHYNRIILSAQAQVQDRFQRDDRSEDNDRDGYDRDQDDTDTGSNDDQPTTARQTPTQAATPVAAETQPMDGSGPQPVIEGTPVEVAMDEETSAASGSRAPSRRRSTTRQRRPRRGAAQGEGEQAAGDAPSDAVLENAAGE